MDQTQIDTLHDTITVMACNDCNAHTFVHLNCSFCHNSPEIPFIIRINELQSHSETRQSLHLKTGAML